MSVAIRPATESDAEALCALVQAFPTPTPCAPEAFSVSLKAMLSDDHSRLMVADEAGHLVGYISGYRHPTFYAGGFTAWVDEVLVVESRRGSGLGRRLMAAFEEWARESNCVLVSLATRGAAPFYDRIGYESKAGYFKKYLMK